MSLTFAPSTLTRDFVFRNLEIENTSGFNETHQIGSNPNRVALLFINPNVGDISIAPYSIENLEDGRPITQNSEREFLFKDWGAVVGYQWFVLTQELGTWPIWESVYNPKKRSSERRNGE